MKTTSHTIDAKGQSLGRIATRVAMLLRGKTSPTFERNKNPGVLVKVINAGAITMTEKKLIQKTYVRYSGFPGGIKHESAKAAREKKGSKEMVRRAVYRMLPDNKLRDGIMKNLTVSE